MWATGWFRTISLSRGYLARELSALTSRGATVNIVADADMSPSTAWDSLSAIDLVRFDAVVLILGGLEVFTLMPAGLYRRRLTELLVKLHDAAPASLSVFLVETGVPLLSGIPPIMRGLVAKQADAMNTQIRHLAESQSNTTFIDFDSQRGVITTLTGRSYYRKWADLIAPPVAAVLNDEARRMRPALVDEEVRQRSVDALDIDSAPQNELDQIVTDARALFGTAGASVTIIDHDVQLTRAATGMPNEPMPRDISICNHTIQRAEIFVVEDTTTDPRFADSVWVDGERIRFYAGYPVESVDGQRIGALCVVDTSPRNFTDTDAALLRQLAHRVQASLWGDRVSR